jgi:hypothetical protein
MRCNGVQIYRRPSEMAANFYQTKRRHIPNDIFL